MGVLTGFHRLPPHVVTELDADSVSWLLGQSDDDSPGLALGYREGEHPPRLGVDKAWEDILKVLYGTDEYTASAALESDLRKDLNNWWEVRVYTPNEVAQGAAALAGLRLDEIRALALQRELTTYRGDPIGDSIDYVLHHLETVIEFWKEAATAGDGILSGTG
ncbi:hypothetical protein BM536_036855 [Streptomyces phaeoluteigriseus]|jgi:hypothetical protein|uniref:DUF1877 domain-containing protein n=1 Tax=Streptomyces phaeoluteigriseus TaxID=114686 RepID=A0A1V6MI31_9ACTN|nr:DUF1877 family protein [Streptomyces phaeoluteigriseus]OQD52008.1 hypothetical protein BM536_036855 [Streptomyces phaeoluteigriseus]